MSRRAVTASVVLSLGLPLAACSTASPGMAPPPSAAAPASPVTEQLTVTPSASPSAPARPALSGRGWTSGVIPVFPPAPKPQPITLPRTGSVPYLSRIPTTQPVAFLTIDDGYLKSPEAPRLLKAAGIPVTLFLTVNAIKDDEAYFERLQQDGAVIEAHTITHTELRGKSAAFQRHEICGSADHLGHRYHRRPVLFRPPFGDKDATTLRVAHECGIKAAFMWKETVHKGKVRYQEGHAIKPGDIILMHFRPAFVQDFLAALRAIGKAGLTPARLQDYIPS